MLKKRSSPQDSKRRIGTHGVPVNVFKAFILLVFIILFVGSAGFAQVASLYTFSQGTVATNPASTSTANIIIGANWDDNTATFNFPGGFVFNFNGTNYTSCKVSSNGAISFGATAIGATNYAAINSNAGYSGAFCPMSDDLYDASAAPITYKITGTAPNRTLTILWCRTSRYNAWSNVGTEDIYFAINMYETTNAIEVAYGNCTLVNYTEPVQIGLRGTSNSDFHHRNLTSNAAWLNNTTLATTNGQGVRSKNNAKPSNLYTYFRWTPVVCVPPAITSVSTVNPTTCGGSNGSFTVNGTSLSGSYTVTYTSSVAGTVTTGSIAAVSNSITVTGLPAATYTNISIKVPAATCSSNVLAGPYVLSDPAAPSITSVTTANPTTCGGSNGSLTINSASLTGNYTVTYTSSVAGTITTAAIAAVSNSVTVTGLPAATYTNVKITSSTTNCVSNILAGPFTLSNPAAPSITSVTTANPTTCGGSNGSLTINSPSLTGNYTVTYTSSLAGTVTTAAIASVANTVTVSGLPAATYTNIKITSSTTLCVSNILAGPFTLSDPPAPVITSVTTANPTTCGGSNGSLTINSASLTGNYTVTYTSSLAGTVTTAAIAAVANSVTVSGLPAATYSNVKITSSATLCVSNILAGPFTLSDPTPPSITTLSGGNPTTCGGTNGTITITAVSLTGNYTVTYTSSLTGPVTTAPIAAVGNTVTVTGLPAATYTNISIKSSTTLCTSNVAAGPVILSDPLPPSITTVTSTNPTTCGGSQGTITITAASLSGSYTVTYTSSVAGTVTTGAIAAVGNTVTVTGLPAANYTNITIKSSSTLCTSNVLAGPAVLTDPTPPSIVSFSGANTTTCGGSDGTLTVTGITLSGNYTITYTSSVAGTVTTGSIAAVSNTLTITGLPAANYSNLSITSLTTLCTSNVLAGTVVISDPAPPVITGITSVNPVTCGGAQGSITLNVTSAAQPVNGPCIVNYTSSLTGAQTINLNAVNGVMTITNLPAASYTNFSFTAPNNCTSAVTAGPLVLSDPAPPVIVSITTTDPTTCSGNQGTITLNVDSAATPINGACVVNYTSSVTGPQTINLVAVNGVMTIPTLPAGNYTNFSFTTAYNCTSAVTPGPITLSDPAPPVITSITTFDPTTCGGSQGTITLNVDSVATPINGACVVNYTSSVTGAQTINLVAVNGVMTIPSLPAGTYTNFSFTTTYNCTSAVTPGPIVLSDPTPPTIVSITSTDPTSCGGSQGAITLNVDSMATPINGACVVSYTSSVSGAQTINLTAVNGVMTIPVLPAGSYTNFSFSTAYNCTSGVTPGPVVLSDPTPPTIVSISPADPVTCGGSEGSITLNVDSIAVPINGACVVNYTSSLTGPQTINLTAVNGVMTIPSLPAGSYTGFSFTTAYNCTSAVTPGPIVLSDPTPPVISGITSSDPTTCLGSEGSITLNVDSVAVPINGACVVNYTSSVTGPQTISLIAVNGVMTIPTLPAGSYTDFSFTTSYNCTSAVTQGPIVLSDPNPPVVTATTNAPICEGQTLSLTSTVTLNGNPAAANSYSWTGPAFVNPVNQANPVVPNAPASATGVYTVTATIANCTSAPFTINVTVNPAPPVPTLAANTPLCSGNDLHLDVTNPAANFVYAWTGPGIATPDTTTNAVVTNAQTTSAGTYTVSVTSQFGCNLLQPSTINVVINQTPGAPTPVDVVYCQQDVPVALTASPSGNPNDTLKWYTTPTGGVGTTTAPTPSTAIAGNFVWYVSQTTQPGCEGARTPQNVWIKPKPAPPTSSVPTSTYCQFDGTAVPLVAAGDSLQWYTVATGGTPSSTAPTPSTATSGTFTWYVTQTDDGCESNRLPITVTIIPKPQPPVTKDLTYCQYDSSVALTAAGQNIKWYDVPTGGLALTSAPVPSTAVPDTTTWYASQTVQGCESDRTPLKVIIFYKPTAGITASRDEVCQGDTLLFSYVGNGSQMTTYNWTWPIGSTIQSGTGQGPYTVSFSNIGKFDVTLVASENGCFSPTASHSITVKQTPIVTIDINNGTVCTDDPAYLSITYTDMELQGYLWDFAGAHTSTGSTVEHDKGPYYLSWDQPGTYVVKLDVTAKDQCMNRATDTVTVRERPLAKISTAGAINDLCTGDDVELSSTENNYKYTFRWLPRQLFDDNEHNAVVRVHADRSQYITLEVANEYGCTSMDSIMLNTKPCCELLLPSAFSPNGDGKNDLFRIINPGRHKLESLRVFNRFGQEVYTTSNEKDGWNGSYNGIAQDIGVYQYLITYLCNGKETIIKGDVTLVR